MTELHIVFGAMLHVRSVGSGREGEREDLNKK